MLNETDFTLRLEAAVALRKEREGREERSGVDHRKDKSQKKREKKERQQGKSHKRKPAFSKNRDEEENEKESENVDDEENIDTAMETNDNATNDDETSEAMDEEPPEINPCQSLFDNHTSSTPSENLAYMQSTYSFYLPDVEYCIDVEGFLGYCNEKVRWGNMCLYCQKTFGSGSEGVLKHMKDKEHCKVLYERGVDQEEFEVFYDFEKQNRELFGRKTQVEGGMAAMEEVDEEAWEDVDSDEEMNEGDDDDLYAGYQEEIASRGFDITPLGELIFPDGRIVGHRGLARYYKQRFAPDRTERTAVKHAKDAAGDRLYEGRVVNVYQMRNGYGDEDGAQGTRALAASMGITSGSIPKGRNGKGILVNGGGSGGFTSLSLYRYRAQIKKQRRQERQGQKLLYRQSMNTNKMDKKANNLMTGVCTAMMPR